MRLENEFVVPRPVDQAWAVLTDVERIAPCMPGARLTEVVDDDYHGTVRVKVGPVVAQYAGVARFKERDDAAHHAVLEAKGKEKTGRGLASALVTADLIGEGENTRVKVNTDLTISGPLAQFGRGAIAEISGRLLNEFVANLRATVLDNDPPATSTPAPAPASASASTPASATASAPAPGEGAATTEVPPNEEAPASETPAPPDTASLTATAIAASGAAAAGAPAALPPMEPAPEAPNAPAADTSQPTTSQPTTSQPTTSQPTKSGPAINNVAPQNRRVIDAPEAAPVDLTRVAGVPVLKRLIPVAVAAIIVIILLIVWLS